MYHILPESHDNIIGIRVEGYMRPEDYKTFLPFMADLIGKYGTICVLSDLRDFEGVSFKSLIKTLPFAFKYRSAIEKEAVVTDQQWIYTWARILSPFFQTDVRCFSSSEIHKAWKWINT